MVIVEGTGTEDLKRGPGHYPGTAMPGQVGNFVVAGHRTTYGAPFNRSTTIKAGRRDRARDPDDVVHLPGGRTCR